MGFLKNNCVFAGPVVVVNVAVTSHCSRGTGGAHQYRALLVTQREVDPDGRNVLRLGSVQVQAARTVIQ